MNNIHQKLTIPAIGLIVSTALSGLWGIYIFMLGVLRVTGVMKDQLPTNEAEKLGYFVGSGFGYAFGLVNILITPFIVYGAIQMWKGKKYGWAKSSAILALIPLTNCCFIVGVPFGIWALYLLMQPEVKSYFDGEVPTQQYNSPNNY